LRRRRLEPAAIFAASLLAHAALVALWIAARPPELFVEPPAMQVTLVAPPRPPPQPPARRERKSPPLGTPAVPPPREPPVPPPPAPAPAPHALSDEELLAGRATTVGQLRAAQNRGEHLAGKPPCKPMSEHSDRQAPPCRVGGPDDAASRVLADGGSAAAGFALEARRKSAIHDYVESQSPPGVADPRQHPGLRCVFLHRHC
jgi:hypothetical protein